ncbi:EF-hand domain-containing protein [Thalassotalea crassostreae]|uniref:EF-hand domain-containing protein n=1 Tax=Thalassotalea crassostreae TaxID=1763536 RepID=UPI0008381800|nr:EF-hand domain-containing protein [Thalassotalea crassostreae]
MQLKEWVDELFEIFDENKDGVLNRSEFVELIDCLLRERGIKMCESIFHQFDKNHDNGISKEELTEMMIELAL